FTLACGKERGAKGEAVDFAFHAEHAACSPNFLDVERNADDDPAEIRSEAFERCFERFSDWLGLRRGPGFGLRLGFRLRFHCGIALNDWILLRSAKGSELLLRLGFDGDASTFSKSMNCVHGEIVKLFHDAAGPADLHGVEPGCRAETEVNAHVTV